MARYDAFLLRIWRSTRDDGCQWRCRIEHLPRGEQQQFTELGALLGYLQTLDEPYDSAMAAPALAPPPATPAQETQHASGRRTQQSERGAR